MNQQTIVVVELHRQKIFVGWMSIVLDLSCCCRCSFWNSALKHTYQQLTYTVTQTKSFSLRLDCVLPLSDGLLRLLNQNIYFYLSIGLSRNKLEMELFHKNPFVDSSKIVDAI